MYTVHRYLWRKTSGLVPKPTNVKSSGRENMETHNNVKSSGRGNMETHNISHINKSQTQFGTKVPE